MESHQHFQQKILEIQRELEEKDQTLLDIAMDLKQIETVLEGIVEEGKKQLSVIDQAEQGPPFE